MKPSLQANFQLIHSNVAHPHEFPNLTNVAQRRSYASNKDIDQYIRMNQKKSTTQNQEGQDSYTAEPGNFEQKSKDYTRQIDLSLVPTTELPHQVYDENHASSNYTAKSQ